MSKFLEIGLIIVAVSAVAVADVFTKRIASSTSSYASALKNPLIIAVVILYVLQIAIFLYVFVKKGELGTVGVIQTALYALIVITSGILFFNEKMTLLKAIGMGLAVIGVILLNL